MAARLCRFESCSGHNIKAMEITLLSKCIKELVADNDRVDIPHFGSFRAEQRPASYSDRQTTINPPYRKLVFRKGNVAFEDCTLLLGKVSEKAGHTDVQSKIDIMWTLSRLCTELEATKMCKLPGLGVMKADSNNEYYFVADDDLDIYADGLGLEPVSIKASPEQTDTQDSHSVKESPAVPQKSAVSDSVKPEVSRRNRNKLPVAVRVLLIAVIALIAIVCLLAVVSPDMLSSLIDRLLYTEEELWILGR